MKLRAKTSTFCKLIHPKYRNSSVGPKNKKNRSIEIYFSIDLDRNSGRSLSVQINRNSYFYIEKCTFKGSARFIIERSEVYYRAKRDKKEATCL